MESYSFFIGEDLSLIGSCRTLRKLTLGNFTFSNSNSIETVINSTIQSVFVGLKKEFVSLQILRGCHNLVSLRLSDLGPAALCCYTRNLCAALPYARKLQLFRLQQSNVTPLVQLLDSLEKCPPLVQLGLIVPSKSEPFKMSGDEFSRRFVRLVTKLPKLVALYCVLSVPATHCAATNKALINHIVPKRPSFCAEIVRLFVASPLISVGRLSLHGHVDVQQMLEKPDLPLVHSQVLFSCSSCIAKAPYS